jgi:hypothetical protein
VGGGAQNIVTGQYGTLGGGDGNQALGGTSAIVGGGYNITLGNASFIGGGNDNENDGDDATICGGLGNQVEAPGDFIGGGGCDGTTQSANYIEDNAATIGGGLGNVIPIGGTYAFIGGGLYNVASNSYATVPGGKNNIAGGKGSFAAGQGAQAINDSAFVWSDGSAITTSTANNQFMVRSSGGVIIYSSSGNSAGVSLAAGGGSWSSLSDRNSKDDFAPVTPEQMLARVAALPITQWSYKTEQGVRHVGPMAQDFYAAFGVGEDNKHITTVDEGGVALAAIQGLNQKVEELKAELNHKDVENAELKQRLEALDS